MVRGHWTIGTAAALALVGCSERGVLDTREIPDLAFAVTSPTYGAFAGKGPMIVTGTVGTPDAVVLVEGTPATIAADGTWTARVPYDRAWRNIDIEASYRDEAATARIPTFAGFDPVESWPGALTLRLTGAGLEGIGSLLGGLVDSFLTEESLAELIPPIEQDGISGQLTGFEAAPVEVALTPTADALEIGFALRDVLLVFDLTFQIGGQPQTVPVGLGIEEAALSLSLGLDVADDGTPMLAIGDLVIDLSVPTLAFGQADLSWIADLLNGTVDLGQLLTDALAQGLGNGNAIPLGGPIAFEQDLLGTPLSLRLDDLATDSQGLGVKLGLGLGTPIPDDLGAIPFPVGTGTPAPDLSVGLHDGVLQGLLTSDLLDLLEQDIQLPGLPGELLGNLVRSLPGGDQAPESAGWCLQLTPGDARLARFGRSMEASLVNIYLPDATLTFATIPPGSSSCEPWLTAGLALQVGVGLDGTALDLDIQAPEGTIYQYGAEGYEDPEQEERVISQLAGQLQGLLNLLGGLGGDLLDLGSLLGDLGGDIPLDGLSLAIRHQGQAKDASGQAIEGMSEIGIGLFGGDTDVE